jgi:5-methylcytosine-specific restriction endonuclease McrA
LSPARLAELIDSGGCCRLCNAGGPDTTLSLHHRTYKRLGHERPGDLTALCVPCHDVVTDMLRARAYGERELPPLRDVEAPADTVLVDTTYRTVP